MRGKTIRQFLIDGQADGRWASELFNWTQIAGQHNLNNGTDGRWASELSNWTGKAYKIPRSEKDFWTECIVFI